MAEGECDVVVSVEDIAVVGHLNGVCFDIEAYRTPFALILSEDEEGFGGEVGVNGGVGKSNGKGECVGDVAVDGGFIVPVDKVVSRVGDGYKGNLGARIDDVVVAVSGGHAGGENLECVHRAGEFLGGMLRTTVKVININAA